jgi:acetyl esterase/lipase
VSEPRQIPYGDDPVQFGELYLPRRRKQAGTVVVIHGGFWRAKYDLDYGRALARDLAAHGFTAWNVEYRRVGNGGGWPQTGDDVAAAIDKLAELDVDSSAAVAVGHSAGGQLAVWAAGRPEPAVPLSAAVAQAGVLDLAAAYRQHLSDDAVAEFLGGTPDEQPGRYRAADPLAATPPRVPVLCVHSRADDVVPTSQSEAYVAAAEGRAVLREVTGDHFAVIDPHHASWATVRDALPELLVGRLPFAS